MSRDESCQPTPEITLEACTEELRRRCESVARLQAGLACYHEELGVFRNFAREKGLLLTSQPSQLTRAPDDEGNEHQVWFDTRSRSYLKATWPGFFGMRVVHRQDEEPKASPVAYLNRWCLHNELFGDQVEFLGALETEVGMRLMIRQPAITGVPATLEQIESFFTENGWLRFNSGADIAFFNPERNVVISDSHQGNIILMEDGLLAPIDLRVEEISGSLLDTVAQLCGKTMR